MSRIASFCADHIGAHGPTSVDELYRAAHAAKVTTARTPGSVTQALRRSDMFVLQPDGRYTSAGRLLTGAIFTHRIRSLDDSAHFVWAGAELDPLRPLVAAWGEVPVEGGGRVGVSPYRSSVWTVPTRAVRDVHPGGLVGFRWTGDQLRIGPVEIDPSTDNRREQEVRTVLARQRRRTLAERGYNYGYLPPERLDTLVLGALAEVPTLFTEPVRPLDELLGRSPTECLDELCRGIDEVVQREHRIQIHVDLPEPLLMDLEERAGRLGIAPEDFIVGLLGHEMWRTAPRGKVPPHPRYGHRRRSGSDFGFDFDDDDVVPRDHPERSDDRHLSVVPVWDEV